MPDIGDFSVKFVLDFSQIEKGMRDAQARIVRGLRGIERSAEADGRKIGRELGEGISDGVVPGLGDIRGKVNSHLLGIQTAAATTGGKIGESLSKGISTGLQGSQAQLGNALARLGGADAAGDRIGAQLGGGIVQGLNAGLAGAQGRFAQQLDGVLRVATTEGIDIGRALGKGIGTGLQGIQRQVGQTVAGADTAAGSKVGRDLGGEIGDGLAAAFPEVRNRFKAFLQGLQTDAQGAGRRIGVALGEGLSTAVNGPIKQAGERVKPVLDGIARGAGDGFEAAGRRMQGSFGRALSGLQEPASALSSTLAGIGAGAVFTDILNTAGDFESQLIRLREVAGATSPQLEAIRAQAKKLGAETAFSANEAAQAMNILAASGFTVDQTMASVAGTMDLASAAQADLATAADITGAAINQFGLQANQAGKVGDVLVATSNKTAAGLVDLGYALKYAGPLAHNLGMTIEETAGSLGILAKAGIKGEMAGTALRGVLSALLDPSNEAVSIFKELGLSFADLDVTTRGVNPVLETLSKKLTNAGDISAIFGNEAQVAATILLKQRDAINEVTGAVVQAAKDGGGAAALGRANMEGWRGAIQQLSGSFETLKIAIADSGLLARMTTLVQGVAGIISKLSEANPTILRFAGVLTGVVAVVAPITAAIGLFSLAIGAISAPVLAAIAGITALTAGVLAFGSGLTPSLESVRSFLGQLTGSWNGAFASMGGVVTTIATVGSSIVTAAATALAGLPQTAMMVVQQFGAIFTAAITALAPTLGPLFGAITNAASVTLEALPRLATTITERFKNGFAEGIGSLIGSAAGLLLNLGNTLTSGIGNAITRMITAWASGMASGDWMAALDGLTRAVVAGLNALGDAAIAIVRDFGRGLLAGFDAAFGSNILGLVDGAIAGIKSAVAGGITAMKDAALAALKALANGLQKHLVDKVNAVAAAVKEPIDAVKNLFHDLYMSVVGGSDVPDMVNGIATEFGRLGGVMVDPAAAMTGKTAGFFKQLETDVSGSLGRINGQLQAANGNGPLFGGVGADRFTQGAATAPQAGPTQAAAVTADGRRIPKAWRDDAKKAARVDTDGDTRRERIAEMKAEAAELRRLSAAQNVSEAEYEKVKLAIVGERAARELGVKATAAERAAVAELAIEQEKLSGSIERQKTIRDLGTEVTGMQQVAAATRDSSIAAEEARIAVDAQRAARELGVLATDKERAAMVALTTQREMLTAATERNAAIRDTAQEISDQERLNAAAMQGSIAYDDMRTTLEAERVARELGLGAKREEIDLIKNQIVQLEALKKAGAVEERLSNLRLEISEQERLNEAQARGPAAYREMAIAIEVERAARELGVSLMSKEGQELEELIRKRQRLNDMPQPQPIGSLIQAGAQDALDSYITKAFDYRSMTAELIGMPIKGLEQDLTHLLKTGELTFDNLGKSVENFKDRLIEMASQQIIASMLGGMFGMPMAMGGMGATRGGGLFGMMFGPSAKGNVFPSKSGISSYSNSIVKKPTVFPFAKGIGLMGEAGAEAVMPLRRGANGRLGVEAANTNSPPVNIEILDQRGANAPPVQQERTTDANGMERIRLIIKAEMEANISSGGMNKAMKNQFGLAPALRR